MLTRLRAIKLPPRADPELPAPEPVVAWDKVLLEPLDIERPPPPTKRRKKPKKKVHTSQALTERLSLLASIDAARSTLPLSFLAAHGQYKEVALFVVRRALGIASRCRLRLVKRYWRVWKTVAEREASLLFLQRVHVWSRRDAAKRLFVVLERLAAHLLSRRFKRWRRAARLDRRFEKRGRLEAAARTMQRCARRYLERRRDLKKQREQRRVQLMVTEARRRASTRAPRIVPKRRLVVAAAPKPAPVRVEETTKAIVHRPIPKRKRPPKTRGTPTMPTPVTAKKSKRPSTARKKPTEAEPPAFFEEKPPVKVAVVQEAAIPPERPLATLQRRARRRFRRVVALSIRLQRLARARARRRNARDKLEAEAAVAAAVAATTELFLFERQTGDAKRRRRATALLQKRARHDLVVRKETRGRASLAIQQRWRRKSAKTLVDTLRDEDARRRRVQQAAELLGCAWSKYRQRRALELRISARRAADVDLSETLRVHTAVLVLQRLCRRLWRLRRLHLRVTATRLKRQVEQCLAARDRAARRIERLARAHRRRQSVKRRVVALRAVRHALSCSALRGRSSTIVALAWKDCVRRYGSPVRVIARGRIEYRADLAERETFATVIQRAVRRRQNRHRLERRLDCRRLRDHVKGRARRRVAAANTIRGYYVRSRALQLLRELRRDKAIELRKQAEAAIRGAAASAIQKFARASLFRSLLALRFGAARQRLDLERQHRKFVEDARRERDEADVETAQARETLELVRLSAWKMGSDDDGRNYYYNWVTGESSYERPDGWEPSDRDVWVKNMDNRGRVFYYNQLSQESAWFPPCSCCGKAEAKKVCFDCNSQHFCDECFETNHATPETKNHDWRGADADKDVLQNGERHCLVCETRKATLVCRVCRDAYCEECFAETHSHGALQNHETVPFDVARKGWQTVTGRVEGEPTYYFHVTTGESTHEKPEDLMLDEELVEHRKFKEFEAVANDYCAKIDVLQTEIERLQYEKDTTLYQLHKQQEAEHAELDELRTLLVADQTRPSRLDHYKRLLQNPLKFYTDRRAARVRKKQLYRKMLLLSDKQRKDEVAKQAVHPEQSIAGSRGSPVSLPSTSAPTTPLLLGGGATNDKTRRGQAGSFPS